MRLSKSVIGEEEKKAVLEVMTRGYLGMGQEVQKFEQEILSFLTEKSPVPELQVACVNTGTSALHLALQAVGLGPGDEVLVPTLTFVACFQAISATGATPVACDVLETSALLDLNDAEKRITPKTRAILYVHYASEPGDLNSLYALAQKYNLRLVEDAAHAFGCKFEGKRIGTFGDVICFSFDGIKNITSGEGGAVVSKDARVMEKVRDARLLGVEKDTEKRFQNKRSWEFDVTSQGWRYHMSDLMAAIGRVQLKRFPVEFRPKRTALSQLYQNLLGDVSGVQLFKMGQDEVVHHIFPIRVLNGKRELVRERLVASGIEFGIHYKPNHLLTRFGAGKPSLPVAEQLYGEILTLPLHPELKSSDVEKVVETIKSALA